MTWGGTWTEAELAGYHVPFTAETGTEVLTSTPMEVAKFRVSVETGNYDVDVALLPPYHFYLAKHDGLLEPINYDLIRDDLPDEVTADEYGVQGSYVAQMLAYRTDHFPDGGPTSWADFWDVDKFPGPRALENTPVGNIERALLADGMTVDELYPLTDEKLDRAFESLDRIKPHMTVWWDQQGVAQQLLADGEVSMMMITSARVFPLIEEGVPVTPVWNGAVHNKGLWAIPKGDPNARVAHKLIDVAMAPENQETFSRTIGLGYGTTNTAAEKLFSDDELAQMPSAPEHVKVGFVVDNEWWGENLGDLQPRWEAWLLS